MPATLENLLGIDEPIVLGPFGGASSVELTALVSDAGGLGSYGLYGYSAARIDETIASLRAATSRPFAVNLWLPTGDEVAPDDLDLQPYLDALAPLYEELGVQAPTVPATFLPGFDTQLDAVLDAAPAVVSFVYGVPAPDVIERAHRRGVLVIAHRDHGRRGEGARRGGRRCHRGQRDGGGRPSGLVPAPRRAVPRRGHLARAAGGRCRPRAGDRRGRHRRPARSRGSLRPRGVRGAGGHRVPAHASVGGARIAPQGDRQARPTPCSPAR